MKAPMLVRWFRIAPQVRSLLLTLSLLASSTPALSDEPPCVVVNGPTGDPALTQANLTWTRQLLQRLEARHVPCSVLNIDHWARANKMFRDGSADVLFPEIVGDPDQPGVTGRPIALTHGFVIFTRHETGPLHSIDNLRGLKVGTIRGRYYPQELQDQAGINIERGNSLEQNMHKLARGRIEATVEYQADGVALLDRMGLRSTIHHGEEFGVRELAYRFHQTARGTQLRDHFDTVVAGLIDDGTYQRMFEGTSQRLITE
ncbi:MAG: substrate-binding periplasmic protein [Pseudomonadota bacterium]